MNERTIPVPLLSSPPNDLRPVSEIGLTRDLGEPWGGRCVPRPAAGSSHWQQPPDSIPTSTWPRGGETDALEYSGPSGLHSLSNRGMRDVRPLLESPPNLPLDRSLGSGVLRPGSTSKGKRAERTTGPRSATHDRKSTRKFRHSIAQASF